MKKLLFPYLLMSLIIAIGGYIFGLMLEKSVKIGLFAGLYVFVEKFISNRK